MNFYLSELLQFCCNGLNSKPCVICLTYKGPLYDNVLFYTRSFFLFSLISAEIDEIAPRRRAANNLLLT